jgi:translocation and assembly module TamB
MKRTLRRILIGLGAVFAVLVVALAGGFLFLQSDAGKQWLAGRLAQVLSSPDSTVAIEGLAGSVPFDLTVDRITVSDRTGPWLEIDRAQIAIDGSALWHRELAIRALTVARVAVSRMPETASEPQKPSAGIDLSLPKLPVALTIDKLAIDQLALAEPVLGEPAALTFSGQAALGGETANLHLDLARTDGTPGQARLAMTLSGNPAILDLKLDASEPTGQLMARLLNRAEPQPLTVALAGTGPLSSWQGKLTGSVGKLASIESDLGLTQGQGLRLTLDGSATQQDLAPASMQPLLGERLRFAARAALDGDVVTLESLSVTGAAFDLAASARLNNATQDLAGTAKVTLPDLKAAEGLLGSALAGNGQLDLTVEGSTTKPILHAVLTGDRLDAEGFGIAHLDAAMALTPDGAIDREETGWQIDGQGRLTGLTQEGAPLPAGLGDSVDWSLAGKVTPASQSLVLDHASAKGAGLDLTAQGRFAPDGANGGFSLDVAEIAAFGALVKLPRLHGHVSLGGEVATGTDGKVTATLKGSTENFGIGIQAVDVVLGPSVAIDAVATREPDGRIAISNLNVAAAAATLTGNAEYAVASDALSGRIVARMPRLEPLAPAIRVAIRGDATVTGDLGGSLAHPSLQALIEGRDMAIENVPIKRLTAQISVADINDLSGTISAVFDLAGMPAKLDTGYALPPDDILSLRKLALSAGGGRLTGDVDYDTDRDLATGKLAGTFPDLQPFSSVAGITLAGSATTSVNLIPKDGQIAEFNLTGSDVKIGTAEDTILLSQLKLQGRARNLMNDPAGTVAFDAAGVGGGNLRFSRVHADADIHSDSAIDFDGQAGGEMLLGEEGDQQRRLPLTLDLAGGWSKGKDSQSILLSRFSGKLDQDEAKLLQPATLALGAVETRVIGLDLDLAGGHVTGDAAMGKDRLMLKLDAQKLPLEVAGRFLERPMAGTLDLAADLSGSLAAPAGKVTIAGRDLKITDPEASSIPPLDFDLSLAPGAGQLALEGQASMPDAKLLTLTGQVPLDLTASGAEIIPSQRPLSIKLDGEGRLEGFVELLALGEDRLSGQYKVALTVTGTRAAPEAGGQLSVSGGRYLNQDYGTELRNIEATLQGDQARLNLTRFSAQDAQGGNLSATGGIDLAARPAPLLDFKAHLASLRVANSDTARVTADGDVGVEGSLAEPKLTANLTIPRAEFRIPDRLPPNVRTLDVVVIDSRDPHSTAQRLAEARRQAAQRKPGPRVALDLTVTVPGQTFVRGHGLDSEWRGRIKLTGDSDRPEIGGKLQTVRGTIDLLGKSFTIRRGVITFPSGRIDEPRMEVLAEYRASDIVAQANLTGSPTSPNLTLSSTPQLPQDEVLSRVLFGRETSQITPAQGAQLALAANNLANGGPGILDRLRDTIGLDRLDIGAASTNPNAPISSDPNRPATKTEDTGPTVSGGKYVAPGVFVGVEQGTSADTSRAKVEVDILRGLTGYSSVGRSSQIGLDWRLDY